MTPQATYMLPRPGPSAETMAMTSTRKGNVMTASTTRPNSASRHPRVEPGLDDVGKQKSERHQHGKGYRQALGYRIVTPVDALDHEPAGTRDGEHRFGDDRTAQQGTDREAEQRHRRDQRVAQDM